MKTKNIFVPEDGQAQRASRRYFFVLFLKYDYTLIEKNSSGLALGNSLKINCNILIFKLGLEM
ncbi:MAG: hypothetical protein GX765_00330 [Candidatus Moranbacteria bacterium]|jgi:hypothetical protein|nr:hypothetical protein [Candidatus Moranbacteria bacterium]